MREIIRVFRAVRLEIVAFVIGLCILTFELTATRIVAPYMGTTIYTWTSVIGVILASLAIGYALGGIWADKRKNKNDVVLLLVAAALVIGLVTVTKDWMLLGVASTNAPLQVQAFTASIMLFALPTILLGAATPYLARLRITSVESSGRHLSRIDASGTVGSLVGTFLTGYLLFGLIGTTHILAFVSMSLLLASFLVDYRSFLVLRFSIIMLVGLLGVLSSHPIVSGYVRDTETAYSRIVIRDVYYNNDLVRILQNDNSSAQSGVFADGRKELAFEYIRAFGYASELKSDARKYLIIGGGAFTFPEYLAKKAPKATIDTVEIDDKLAGISKKYFNFDHPSNLNIISADGRQFLNKSKTKYDMIYIDAFSSFVPPFQLLTKEAISKMNSSLTGEGVLVANIISAPEGPKSEMIKSVNSTFRTGFKHVSVYRVSPTPDYSSLENLLLIASDKPLDQSAMAKVAKSNPEFERTLLSKLNLNSDHGIVLTDDYAPVEDLALR